MSGIEEKEATNPEPAAGNDNMVAMENMSLSPGKKTSQMGTSPRKIWEILSIGSKIDPPELGITPLQILEHFSKSPKKSASQSVASPGKNTCKLSTNSGKTTDISSDGTVQKETQGNIASGGDLNGNNFTTNQNANKISQSALIRTSETGNAAQLTATAESSSLKRPFLQPPAVYDSPYLLVNDPFGHHASAKRPVLGIEFASSEAACQGQTDASPTVPEAVRLEQIFRKKYLKASNEQIMEAVSCSLAHPKYLREMDVSSDATSGPYISEMGSVPFTPINRRSGTFAAKQNQGREYYPHIPSSNFGRRLIMSSNGVEVATPLEKPVVLGRLVQRHRKRTRTRDDDDDDYVEVKRSKSGQKRFGIEDFEGSQASKRRETNSPFCRVEIPQGNEAHTGMHDEHSVYQLGDFQAPRSASSNPSMNEYGNLSGRNLLEDEYLEDSESELFVSDKPPPRSSNSGHPADYDYDSSLGSSGATGHSGNRQSSRTYSPRSTQKRYFNIFGQRLEPSRYSGAAMPWDVSIDPEMVDQSEVSNASLLKRNIARGKGKRICKRGYGASDPENIAIVNMKEFDDLSFDDIAKRLNEKRVAEGREPSLSAVGVNSRYNRTAPLLFSAQGKEFIPLSKRKGKAREILEANRDGVLDWNDELDIALVSCVKEVDAARWNTVALLFEERTGKKLNASTTAVRHNLL